MDRITYAEPLILVCLVLCVIGMRSCRPKKILALGLLGLFLISWPPSEWLLARPLESPYPIRPFQTALQPQAIVVLGSAVSPPHFEQPYSLADRDTFEHCAMASWIYRERARLPILACEGSHGEIDFPSGMRELLRSSGVPDDSIWVEDRAHNTHENAWYGAGILKQHNVQRIILVTDAQSMRRAAACFRKLGFMVIPAPCTFGQLTFSYESLLPSWKAIRRSERSLHEMLGLTWYSLKGWI